MLALSAGIIDISRCSRRQGDGVEKTLRLEAQNAFHFPTATTTVFRVMPKVC
jgi:hypothetical protein